MSHRFVPLVTGFLPIVAIHASLFLAVNAGVIPACMPYVDGCASISATGRYEPAVFLFKPSMTAEAVLMVFYWILNATWIRSLASSTGTKSGSAPAVMATLGVAGALALIVYVTFLGTQAPFYEFMRRFGIYLYFLFTVVAQLMLAVQTIRLGKTSGLASVLTISRVQLWLALAPFALGVLNLGLKSTLDDADSAENVIEWIAALLMHFYFVLTFFTWRETGFAADWSVNRQRR